MAFADALADWQWRYINGVRVYTWGADQDLETLLVDGWDSWGADVGDVKIPRSHGSAPGKHLLASRDPVFTLDGLWGSQTDYQTARQALLDELVVQADTVGTVEVKRPGQPQKFLRARPVAVDWPEDSRGSGLAAQVKLGFTASDPRIYSVATKQDSLSIFNASGGLNYPVDYPKNYSVSGNDVDAVNVGNTDAYPLIRFYGPTTGTCTGVQLANLTTGVTVDIQTSLVAGQILVADMSFIVTRVASDGNSQDLEVHIAGSSRYGSWQQTRTPLALAPGSNVLRFSGAGTTTGMLARVDYRDTWL